jgi:hypothetical protein
MRQTKMKRNIVLALVIGAVAALATVAWAGANFKSATGTVNDTGALVVSFDESGLGNENVDYTLTADATALYACINKGGKNPSAANKQSFEDQLAGGASFEPKNGRVQGDITVGPLPAPGFTCPSGQTRILAHVSYSNIVLTDTTNNKSITVADTSRCLRSDIPGLCP